MAAAELLSVVQPYIENGQICELHTPLVLRTKVLNRAKSIAAFHLAYSAVLELAEHYPEQLYWREASSDGNLALAAEEAISGRQSSRIFLTPLAVKSNIEQMTSKLWEREWAAYDGRMTTKRLFPSVTSAKNFTKMKSTPWSLQILTGKANLNAYIVFKSKNTLAHSANHALHNKTRPLTTSSSSASASLKKEKCSKLK